MNEFGVKNLSKQERALLNKTKKSELIDEANSLNIMVDDRLTKLELFNIINTEKNKYKRLNKPISIKSLLDALPEIQAPISRIKGPYRVQDEIVFQQKRMPPGSKIIRKEQGLSRSQKTELRNQITDEIDRLSDLLEQI